MLRRVGHHRSGVAVRGQTTMLDVSVYAWVLSAALLWCGLKSWTLSNSIAWAARKGNDFDYMLRHEVPKNLQEQVRVLQAVDGDFKPFGAKSYRIRQHLLTPWSVKPAVRIVQRGVGEAA